MPLPALGSICAVAFGSYQRFAGLFAYSALRAVPGTQVVILVDRPPTRREAELASMGKDEFGGDVVWERSVVQDLHRTRRSPVAGGFLKVARWLAPGHLFTGEVVLFTDVDSIFLINKRYVFENQRAMLGQTGLAYSNYRRHSERRLTGGNHWTSPSYFTQVKSLQRKIVREGLPEELTKLGSGLRDEHVLWHICEATSLSPWNMHVFSVESHQTGRFPGIHYGVGRNLNTIDIRLTREDRISLREELAVDAGFMGLLRKHGNLQLDNVMYVSGALARPPSSFRRLDEMRLRAPDLLRRAFGRL